MLDIRWIRENPQALVKALVDRGSSSGDAQATVDGLVAKDEARRSHLTRLQEAQARQNAASKEIGNAIRAGDTTLGDRLKAEVAELKTFVQGGEATGRDLDRALNDALAVIPNIPLDDVPVGKDEHANVEIRRVGEPQRSNSSKEHFELGEALGFMDFERAAKLSGARFTVLSGRLARLERALGQFMLDLHTTEHGYTEVIPPLMVRDEAMFGTGQLPKFRTDLFGAASLPLGGPWVEEKFPPEFHNIQPLLFDFLFGNTTRRDVEAAVAEKMEPKYPELAQAIRDAYFGRELWLIPTSEVPLTNLVREEIVAGETLPRRYTALTPCFRSEAGSAGRDTRGMLRQHQFYKVELVSITDQENSLAEHERMTACAEEVLKCLGLPFRTMVLSTGDMGFGARRTYDIEVWLPGQNAFREISSCSVCGDFQARRMNARYRGPDGKPLFVHTLNGSGVAVGRALIAVMENYQDVDGSIHIPDVLQPYMGGLKKIEAA